MSEELATVGFIGLGIMGLPMAGHLARAGYPVTVYNRTPSKSEGALLFGARVARNPRDLASECRYLITMVTDGNAIRGIMEGPEGILSTEKRDLTWIQMSTIDLPSTHEFADAAEKKGWSFLDCPVTGSKKQVEESELILLAGGKPKVLEDCRALLLRLGKTVVHAGDVGAGTALKLCVNLVLAQMTTAMAEAAALATAEGIDPAKVFEVIKQSPALDCGYFRIKEESVLNWNFPPAFSLANMLKDVRFMTAEAGRRGQSLPVTSAVQAVMERSLAEGHGPEDLMSIYLTLCRGRKQ